MEIRFTQSARKHRIGKARAKHVIKNYSPTYVKGNDEESDKQLWIGQDNRGLELEIVAIVLEEYLLVVHVMPTTLRKGRESDS